MRNDIVTHVAFSDTVTHGAVIHVGHFLRTTGNLHKDLLEQMGKSMDNLRSVKACGKELHPKKQNDLLTAISFSVKNHRY